MPQKPIYRHFVAVFATTREPLLARSTRHCNKGYFSDHFDKPQKSYFCIWNLCEKCNGFVDLQAIFGNFLLFPKNRLHAYLPPPSKQFFGLDSLQGPQQNTNTKKVTHCFAWNNLKAKNAFFQNWKKAIFQFLRWDICQKRFCSVSFERRRKTLKNNIFDKSFVNFLWNFWQYFKLPWLFFILLLLKLAGLCKTLMSTCPASFRFFHCMELEAWAFEGEKWWRRPMKQTLLPGTYKHVKIVWPTFFPSQIRLWLRLSMTNTPFFPVQHHKHAFDTTTDVSSPNLAYNLLRVDVASVAREVSQNHHKKPMYFAPINYGKTFLLMCLSTICGERALSLDILKLSELPKQGPQNVLDKARSSIPPPKIRFSVVHMA